MHRVFSWESKDQPFFINNLKQLRRKKAREYHKHQKTFTKWFFLLQFLLISNVFWRLWTENLPDVCCLGPYYFQLFFLTLSVIQYHRKLINYHMSTKFNRPDKGGLNFLISLLRPLLCKNWANESSAATAVLSKNLPVCPLTMTPTEFIIGVRLYLWAALPWAVGLLILGSSADKMNCSMK